MRRRIMLCSLPTREAFEVGTRCATVVSRMTCRNTATRTRASEGALRVLLIDGDDGWLQSAKRELQVAGLHVDTESSPEDAIELALVCNYDMVIISDFMPKIGHLVLLDRLKRHPALRENPVFVLATEDTVHVYDLAMQHLADGYALRPTRTAKLAGVLTSTLDIYQARLKWRQKGRRTNVYSSGEGAR